MTEEQIRKAVKSGILQYWRDVDEQGGAYLDWKKAEWAGDRPQIIQGDLTYYITRSVMGLEATK